MNNNIKVGDKLKIHCYKHDGRLERVSDEAIVLDVNDELIVCGNYKTKMMVEVIKLKNQLYYSFIKKDGLM